MESTLSGESRKSSIDFLFTEASESFSDSCLFEIHNLSKHFGGLHAVDNLSLEIKKGEIVGFIGPNGAGKTTFCNLVTGLLRPDSGVIIFKKGCTLLNKKI